MKILETDDLIEIIRRNRGGDFGPRNEAAILMAALLGLTAGELSKVAVSDVLKANGEIRKNLVVPASIAFNGYEREVPIEHPRLFGALEHYIEMMFHFGWSVVNGVRYRKLDPKRAFILNDKGQPFGFSRRSKRDPDKRQPTGLNTLFRSLIGRTRYKGTVTFVDFRRSYIVHMARSDEGDLSIRNLMEVSGIRDYGSVKKIVNLDTRSVTKAVRGIYTRL